MSIGLVDENGAPRSGCSVVIWATEETTLTAGGQQYTIGPGNTATIAADSAGEIYATLTGGLAAPNIWMTPDFFIDGFSMEVFPDTENLNRLSTVTGTDLMAATGYNGQPVMQQAYRSGASAESLALAIQNGVGRQSSVSASSAVRIRKAGDSGGRSLQPGRSWGFEFTNEGARFRYRSELDAGRESRQLAEARDFLGIGDFIANIVEGTADEIESLTWTWDNDLVQVFVTGLNTSTISRSPRSRMR
jgi:hypothetical protein